MYCESQTIYSFGTSRECCSGNGRRPLFGSSRLIFPCCVQWWTVNSRLVTLSVPRERHEGPRSRSLPLMTSLVHKCCSATPNSTAATCVRRVTWPCHRCPPELGFMLQLGASSCSRAAACFAHGPYHSPGRQSATSSRTGRSPLGSYAPWARCGAWPGTGPDRISRRRRRM